MSTTLAEDAATLRELKVSADALDKEAKEAKAAATQAELEFFERMDSEGVKGIKVGDTNFVPAETVYGQVQDRSAFVAWAQTEMPELLETKERKALVNEIIRERIDSGEAMPPGLGFYVRQYVSQRAAGRGDRSIPSARVEQRWVVVEDVPMIGEAAR